MKPIRIWVSPGELIDRASILRIKLEHTADALRQTKLHNELRRLDRSIRGLPAVDAELCPLTRQLMTANQTLWDAEDHIRRLAREHAEAGQVAQVALLICRTNDRRVALKQRINAAVRSTDIDEKVYARP